MRTLLFLFLCVCLNACRQDKNQAQSYNGAALGTTYHIQFFSKEELNFEKGIDSVFEAVNRSMSTYLPTSDISRINKGDTTVVVDAMFKEVFALSKEINKATEGYFDPTVGNLVNAYGFGSEKLNISLDSTTIDSLMQYVGLDKISISKEGKLLKQNPHVYLEFNAIGKGYAVDRLGVFLEQNGVKNYIVEVGGELRTKGINKTNGKEWKVGIDNPLQTTEERTLSTVLKLKNRGMATSGNYRKYRFDSISGKKYVHTINPITGFSEKSRLLSASVLAKNCATADAYATAFMAMGFEKAKKTAQNLNGIEVFFLYDDAGKINSFFTKGFKKLLVE